MFTRTRMKAIAVVGVVAMVAVGYVGTNGAAASTSKSSAASGGQSRNGGSVTFGEFAPLTSLDPTKFGGFGLVGGSEAAAVYGELMRYNAANGQFVPEMAKSLSHSPDFTQWTLRLRPGVRFSDGTPYDAAAVVANIERQIDPKMPSQASNAAVASAFVKSVTATNSTTVVFTLTQPWSGFPYELTGGLGFIAAPSYLAHLAAGDTTATAIGAGPFKVSSFQPAVQLTLSPNDQYFAGRPHLDSLKFVYIPGGTSTLQSFQSGQLEAAILYDQAAVKQATEARVPAYSTLYALADTLTMNCRAPSPLSNPRLREAISLALSPKLYNRLVFQGAGVSDNHLFPPGSEWYSPSLKGVPYNPAKAKALVAQVKKQTGWDGTLQFASVNTNPAVPVAVETMLRPLGIKLVASSNLSIVQLINQVKVQRNYQLAAFGITAFDSGVFPGLWTFLDSASSSNYSGCSSPQFDAALSALRVAPTKAATQAALQKVNRAWNATWPMVNLGPVKLVVVHKANLHGLSYDQGGIVLFSKAWLS